MDITAINKSSTTTDLGTVGTTVMAAVEGTEDMDLLKVVVAGEVSYVTTCHSITASFLQLLYNSFLLNIDIHLTTPTHRSSYSSPPPPPPPPSLHQILLQATLGTDL